MEETMTRSKRKREMEMEIANSKVLRNDKLIKCNALTMDKKNNDPKPANDRKSNSKLTDSPEKNRNRNSTDSALKRSKSIENKKKRTTVMQRQLHRKSPIYRRKICEIINNSSTNRHHRHRHRQRVNLHHLETNQS